MAIHTPPKALEHSVPDPAARSTDEPSASQSTPRPRPDRTKLETPPAPIRQAEQAIPWVWIIMGLLAGAGIAIGALIAR